MSLFESIGTLNELIKNDVLPIQDQFNNFQSRKLSDVDHALSDLLTRIINPRKLRNCASKEDTSIGCTDVDFIMKTIKRDELLAKQVLSENCQQEKVKLSTEFQQVQTIVDTFKLSRNETPELRSESLVVFLKYFGFENAEEWVHKIVWTDSTELQG